MPFVDKPLRPQNKKITGLGLAQTAPLTLEVGEGSLEDYSHGEQHTFPTTSHAFSPDPTHPTSFYMALVSDGATLELWVDQVVLKNKWQRHISYPDGYRRVLELAWGTIAAGETDLINSDISRRIHV